MTETEALAEIAAGESQHREFKRLIDNPESIAGEIVAFANTEGGRLFVGVDDDGSLFGVSDPAQTIQTLTNICRELIRIAQSAGEMHYDEAPVRGAGLDTLSEHAFGEYYERQFGQPLAEGWRHSGLSLAGLLENMRLAEMLEGEPTLTVTGVLIFGEDPQRFLPHSRLSAVAFAGGDEDSEILDRHELTGRLPQIIEDARVFLRRNVRVAAQELGFERRDFPQYDLNALGEAVVNAIAHRDYSLSGSQIRLFVFSDRIEVRSPGRLPNSVTLENIRLGVHAERNRRLATLLTHLGYMSAIGTGVPRLILRLSRQLSGAVREPEYTLVGEELRLTIWAAQPPIAAR